MPIRLLYVFDTTSDVRFIEGFARRFVLTVLRPSTASSTNEPTTEHEEVVTKGGRFAFMLRSALWMVSNRKRYDVIVVLDNLTAALTANLVGRALRRPVILMEGRTTVEYYNTKGSKGSPAHRLGLVAVKAMVWTNQKLSSAVAPCSRWIASRSRARRTVVIPWYGIDTNVYRPDPSRTEARHALSLPEGVPIAIYRSRIAPEKDPQTFLAAINLLGESGIRVIALYVGGEHETFRTMAEEAGTEAIAVGHVHPFRELPLYYRAADILVQTSKAEGLGVSVLEAMASETPVIASAVGGLLETVRPGETGILTPVGDAQKVAEAVKKLLTDAELAADLATKGRLMVEREYSAELAFGAWERLIRSVV